MKDSIYQERLEIARFAGEEKACGDKIDWRTEKKAMKKADSLRHVHKRKFTYYPCPFCGGWHVGGTSSVLET